MKTQIDFRVGWDRRDLILDKIRVAKAVADLDRGAGKSLLNDLFRDGVPPERPVEGHFAGNLLLLDIAPGLSTMLGRLADTWTPWRGMILNANHGAGENVFSCDSLALMHVLFPLYRHIADDGPNTFRAFGYRTRLGSGLSDPDRTVLKIDYGLPENPGLTIRRMLDELVQVSDDLYLGKTHVHWWWGKWQMVAFFALTKLLEAE